MAKINLKEIKKYQTGTIVSIKADGELGRRIRDMGRFSNDINPTFTFAVSVIFYPIASRRVV